MSIHRRQFIFCVCVAVPIAIVLAFVTRPAIETATDATAFDTTSLKSVLESRRKLDQTLWAPEIMSQRFENTIIQLWDDLRADPVLLRAIQKVRFDEITVGRSSTRQRDGNGIESFLVNVVPQRWTAGEFYRWVGDYIDDGWVLEQSEWHHERVEQSGDGEMTSTVQIVLHLNQPAEQQRFVLSGPIEIVWSSAIHDNLPMPSRIDATGLIAKTRRGKLPFQQCWTRKLEEIQSEATHNDVLAHDLDGDGFIDLVYPRTNLLFHNDGTGSFYEEPLCVETLNGICEGVLVDFDRDGQTDLICAAVNEDGHGRGIYIYKGDEQGGFSHSPKLLTALREMLSPDSITMGDIDADGDLDLFVTQYHAPYRDGKMPAPYYDANDGLPAFLLLNDGAGRLRDVTEERGLGAKRLRRTYRSSLVDLDDDQDLDLLVTSDFSGVDVYENNGRGYFQDVTADWIQERTLFGMSHVIADFDNDSQLDIYATGMSSTTARRLDSLGLVRTDFPENKKWRSRLAYGNRLYFARGGFYQEEPPSTDVARAGWSWGCAAFDVENDGDVDLYVANGHLSGKSSADYCTRFWCHDIYLEHSAPDGFMDLVRRNTMQLGNSVSWNGYEKNRLFLNDDSGFKSAAYLLGLAIEEDSRSVLAEDLNNDGKVDLIVGYADRTSQVPQYNLTAFKNGWPSDAHWIGVTFGDRPAAEVIGAKVLVHTPDHTYVDTVTIGESFAAQASDRAHFGLGTTSEVTRIEIRWTGGGKSIIERPDIDQYHMVP